MNTAKTVWKRLAAILIALAMVFGFSAGIGRVEVRADHGDNQITSTYAVWEESRDPIAATVDLSEEIADGILKTLTLPKKGVDAPDETFTFTFTPVDGTEKGAVSAADTPAIPDVTISFSASDVVTGGKVEKTTTDLGTVTYKDVGIYTYIVKETKGSNADMTYDDTEYTLKLRIKVNEQSASRLMLGEIYLLDSDGNKGAALEFENDYAPDGELVISKTVTNLTGDPTQFAYTITFSGDAITDGATPLASSAYPTSSTAAEAADPVNATFTFVLKSGESIKFKVPAGTDYTITEAGVPNYDPSATAVQGGIAVTGITDAETGEAQSVSACVGTGENKVDFANEYKENPLTGLHDQIAPYATLVLAAAVGIAVYLLATRRRRAG